MTLLFDLIYLKNDTIIGAANLPKPYFMIPLISVHFISQLL
jgi:hypothetical protein